MARSATFPADDVSDRTDEILAVLKRHDPVPVPSTTLYLSVRDKRHLADAFEALVREGWMERARVAPDDPQFAAVARLAGLGHAAAVAPVGVFRLTDQGRSRDA